VLAKIWLSLARARARPEIRRRLLLAFGIGKLSLERLDLHF
jgi:hypothetical protein